MYKSVWFDRGRHQRLLQCHFLEDFTPIWYANAPTCFHILLIFHTIIPNCFSENSFFITTRGEL